MSQTRTLWGHIRTFVVVTLITVMVWLLAESRMIQTQTLEAQVVLTVANSPGGVPLVVRQSTDQAQIRTVSVQIEGSTAGLDRFTRVLQNRVELRIGREIPAKPGIHTIDFRSILRQSSQMSVHGLTVTAVVPESITVEVDELETREFPVRVLMPPGVETDGAPRADPESVKITAPSSVLNRVQTSEAIVRIDSTEIAQLGQGRLETIPGVVVEVQGIDRQDWASTIEPGQVDVFVTLRTLSVRYTIDRLPVQVLLAPGEIGKWVIEIADADKDLVNVELVGSAEAIEQLRSGSATPRAYVNLSFEELERGIESKPAQILGLPQGSRVVGPQPTISFKISRVESGSSVPAEPESGTPGP
jgi:YbbR domain-containing protein